MVVPGRKGTVVAGAGDNHGAGPWDKTLVARMEVCFVRKRGGERRDVGWDFWSIVLLHIPDRKSMVVESWVDHMMMSDCSIADCEGQGNLFVPGGGYFDVGICIASGVAGDLVAEIPHERNGLVEGRGPDCKTLTFCCNSRLGIGSETLAR